MRICLMQMEILQTAFFKCNIAVVKINQQLSFILLTREAQWIWFLFSFHCCHTLYRYFQNSLICCEQFIELYTTMHSIVQLNCSSLYHHVTPHMNWLHRLLYQSVIGIILSRKTKYESNQLIMIWRSQCMHYFSSNLLLTRNNKKKKNQ